MHPSVSLILRNPHQRAAIERALATRGRYGDTMLAHISPAEALMLKRAGGAGTRNPRTGLPEFWAGGPGSDGNGGTIGGTDRGGLGANPGGTGAGGIRGSGRDGSRGEGGLINWEQYYNTLPLRQQPAGPIAPAAPSSNMPPANGGVGLYTLMSKTPTTDLTGGRFGPLPAYATTPYAVGQVPTSYPTPGVDTSAGAPGGSPALPGGGSGLPGGLAGFPGVSITPPAQNGAGSITTPLGTIPLNPGQDPVQAVYTRLLQQVPGLRGATPGAQQQARSGIAQMLMGRSPLAQALGGGSPQPASPQPAAQPARNWGANAAENQALARATGYQGNFGSGQFQAWLARQPASVQAAAQRIINGASARASSFGGLGGLGGARPSFQTAATGAYAYR